MLPPGLTEEVLAAATAEPDPDSLAAGQRLRLRFGGDLAAAALTQAALRRRAVAKFGAAATGLFFTRDGLEQATRAAVAVHHADRFRAGGVTGVIDLGCGIGADALAFLDAGLAVRAVELDPATAAMATANLQNRAAERGSPALFEGVAVGDAAAEELDAGEPYGWFADPARRTGAGRVWRTADFTPPWSLVERLLSGDQVAGVKLGPALPHDLVPAGVEAEWVTHRGSTVEVALWAGGAAVPDGRRATVLDAPGGPASLLVDVATPVIEVGPIGRYVYEPVGALLRAGGLAQLAGILDATLVGAQIAYLTADHLVPSPFARAYEAVERLAYAESALRRWLRAHDVGALEIKQRGIDLDPAILRKRLAPRGAEAATLLITRTPTGAAALVVRRV